MKRAFLGSVVFSAALVGGWLLGDLGPRRLSTRLVTRPAPIAPKVNLESETVERKGGKERRAWFDQRHRRAPDVDWKAIEAENGRAQIEKRNRLAGRRAGTLSPWVERGSDNLAGSMYTVALSEDGSHLYAGSAFGGLWRGTLDGDDWEPLGDNLYGGANRIVALPPDSPGGPDVVLVGQDGGGVWRSADDGQSWLRPQGLDGYYLGLRRLVEATDGSVWIVFGSMWGGDSAVLRSTDRGATFTKVLDMNTIAGDLWVPRTGGATAYALAGTLKVSKNGGKTWEERGTPGSGQVELVGSEAGALYAMTHAGGLRLHVSRDDGFTWSELPDRPKEYWDQLSASIVDPDLVAWGAVNAWRSEDGGASSEPINEWYEYYDDPLRKLHADIMAFTVLPDADGGETWYLGTHGGIYQSKDGLRTVKNISMHGLRVSQYYDVHTSTANPEHVIGGAQDQGWQRTAGAPWDGDDVFDFEQLVSGDYGQLSSGDGTHDFVFAVYPGFITIQQGEDDPEILSLDYPPDEDNVPIWMPAVVADPDEPKSFFFLAGHLWRYDRVGGDWEVERWSNRDFEEEPGETLSAMMFAPSDSSRLYGATSAGRIFTSVDGGVSWQLAWSGGPEGHWLYGAAVLVSATNPDIAWVGGSGYSGPSVLQTTDGGVTWTAWDDGLPPTLVYSLCEAGDGSGAVFAGTETSAYRRDPGSGSWEDLTSNQAPITTYWSCETLHHEDTIRFGTYGRGIWDYQLAPQGEGCYPALDEDLDGVNCALDCDDADPSRYPGADDPCDGVDQDCDGTPEEDGDADGFLACADCDDADATIHPGAIEVCPDEIDQDCDGEEGPCPAVSGCATTPVAPGWAGLALALALLRRRRRAVPAIASAPEAR